MDWTPRVERRGRCGGQLGGPGLERLAQGVSDLVDEGAWHEGGLARAYPGHRRVLSNGGKAAQNAVWAADQHQEEDAQGSVLQEVWRGHEQDRQGGPHGERFTRRECAWASPPTRLKAFRTTVGRCLPGTRAGRSLTLPLAMHQCDPTHTCRIEPIAAWAEAVWDEQLDDADLHKAWRRQQATGGPEAVVEQSQRAPRAARHHVFEAVGMVMASPHDLRHCKWARGGLATDLRQGRRSAGASGQRIGAVARVGRHRRAEGVAPVPLAGTCETGKQTSPTSTARGASNQGGSGCDNKRVGGRKR